MSDLSSLMADDAAQSAGTAVESIGANSLSSISEIATSIRLLEKEIESREEALRDMKRSLRTLQEEELPSKMMELGLSSFKMDDGSAVEIKKLYGATILKDNEPQAFEWLRSNGHGGIVKNTVSVDFGMGEDETAQQFKNWVQSQGHMPKQKEGIHHSSLRSWVKEMVEDGKEFPMELFGAYVGQKAVIKGAK